MEAEETKVDIRDLIELASYSIVKGTVKPFEELKKEFSTHMGDMFLDEDLADHVGEPCYYIYDDCDMGVRACFIGDKCDKRMLDNIIDNLHIVFYETIYEDTVDNFIEDDEAQDNLSCSQSYEDLYNYIVEHNVDVSDWKLSWLKVLGLGRDDLLIEFED